MNDYRINISYAKALLMTAEEKSVAERVSEDMRLVNAVCKENSNVCLVNIEGTSVNTVDEALYAKVRQYETEEE